jgi:CRP-like cAMP-binding protein
MAEQLPETVDKMIERILGNGPLSADDWQSVLIDIAFATTEGQDPTAMLALCKVLQHERLQQGHVIFREGDEGSDIYIVLSGSVEVTKRASSVPVNVCTAGSFFGELALLYSDPLRRSTMTACEPTHIARVEAAELVKHQIDLVRATHVLGSTAPAPASRCITAF